MIDVLDLFAASSLAGAVVRTADGIGDRSEGEISPNLLLRLDRFDDSACAFLRYAGQATSLDLRLRGRFSFALVPAGGWLAYPLNGEGHAYWFPQMPQQRRLSPQQHILSDAVQAFTRLGVDAGGLSASVDVPDAVVVDLVCWQLPLDVANGLREISVLESQPYFLWGSHTAFGRASDLYRHIVFGTIYEDRYSWPFKRRICSENDAHALYVLLSGLHAATNKSLLGLLRRQIILSVLLRQTPQGAFRHGEWTPDLEAHFRLQCSAMHLMMDSLCDYPSTETRRCLALAAEFLQTARTQIDAGAWFLHDELELSEATMRKGPFRWLSSRALGKSPSNMLVLNTHLDATVALHRYAEVTGDVRYAGAVQSAIGSTRHLLALRPMEWLYRLVFWPISLTLLPAAEQGRLPLLSRIAKHIGWKYLIPNLNRLKVRFPRLVMPGGYIDRALPLATWSFHYLTVNLMDLVRHQRRMPSAEIKSAIDGALHFVHGSGVLARWVELSYERYALGFWAEALFQLCHDQPDSGLEQWLAEATLLLEDLHMGLPPSVLGTNAEINATGQGVPCPQPPSRRLRLLNLGGKSRERVLVVNCGDDELPCGTYGCVVISDKGVPPRAWRLVEPPQAAMQPQHGFHVAKPRKDEFPDVHSN